MLANAEKAGLRKSLEREVNAHAKTTSELATCTVNVETLEAAGKRQAAAVLARAHRVGTERVLVPGHRAAPLVSGAFVIISMPGVQ